MTQRRDFSAEDDAQIALGWNAGVSTRQIGRQLERAEGSISKRVTFLRHRGVALEYRRGAYASLAADDRVDPEILELMRVARERWPAFGSKLFADHRMSTALDVIKMPVPIGLTTSPMRSTAALAVR